MESPWLTTVATFLFGAAHAAAASRVADGRHRTSSVSVRSSVTGRHTRRIVIVALVALGAFTVALSLLARANGAGHPGTAAPVVVAIIIVLGGPRLFAAVRRRAADAPVAR